MRRGDCDWGGRKAEKPAIAVSGIASTTSLLSSTVNVYVVLLDLRPLTFLLPKKDIIKFLDGSFSV
jgi:hypothetical protein